MRNEKLINYKNPIELPIQFIWNYLCAPLKQRLKLLSHSNRHVKFNSILKMDSISLSTEKQYMQEANGKKTPPSSKTVEKWKARKMNANPNIQSNKINTVSLVFIDHEGIHTYVRICICIWYSHTILHIELSWAEQNWSELN